MATTLTFVRLGGLCAALVAGTLVLHAAGGADSGPARVDALARDLDRAEAIRAVKNLQYAYSHYAQFGLWAEVGALFAENGESVWGDDVVKGPAAIAQHDMKAFGGGKPGLPPGAVHNLFVEVPLVNLSADGNSAKARWYGFFMLGGGADARWDSGTFENEYVKENGVWKIARLHYFPQFGGLYEKGWTNVTNPLPLIPYHFKNEDEAGTPIPAPVGPAPKTSASLASLEQRVDALNAEDQARNLQNAYGYYVDRKMWDDVTDLFTSDGVLQINGAGRSTGPANIRKALERDGSAGLKQGELNDHPLFDTMIEIAPDGLEARVRGLDLGILGDFASARAQWSVSIFSNRFVKQNGVWKIREMHLFPLFTADYAEGWGKSRIATVAPPFLSHPVTRKASPRATAAATTSGNTDARVAEAERKLAVSKAYDGAENITSAYTHYIDDGQWTSVGAIFAEHGAKHVPFNGYYVGPERIAHRPGARPAVNSTNPGRGGWHWLMQPVIHVAPDGRSAKMRTRLFHPGTGSTGGGLEGGMYPNNQAVLEKGVWKLWALTIDEPYFSSQFPYGWSRTAPPRQAPAAAARPAGTPAPPTGAQLYPPDIPQSLLGKRMEGFVGGTGEAVRWPGILNMWFHYKNPVSGRVPPYYWPNCGTCEYAPKTSMENFGYMLPPS